MTIDINAAIAAEVATGPDMTKASGGGERTIAAAGPTRLRFIGYIEVGKHEKTVKGNTKLQDQVHLIFELSGKNHPLIEGADGKKYPQRIVVKENKSLNEKANFFKLFQRMNYSGKATHMAQLLGDAFLGTVSHYTFKGNDGKDVTIPQLRSQGAYDITPPRLLDPATEEYVTVNVDLPYGSKQVFFWNTASKEQWDSIFVDGEYEERKNDKGEVTAPAKSKNILQNLIKSAQNFKGSPVEAMLVGNGVSLDIPSSAVGDDEEPPEMDETPASTVPQGKAADDALNGIVG
jgi:hypothetical protein